MVGKSELAIPVLIALSIISSAGLLYTLYLIVKVCGIRPESIMMVLYFGALLAMSGLFLFFSFKIRDKK